MKVPRLNGRTATLASAIAVTLFSGVATSSTVTVSTLNASRLPTAGTAAGISLTRPVPGELARYTVVLKDAPLASYSGEPIKTRSGVRLFGAIPRTARGRVDVASATAQTYVAELQAKQQDFVNNISADLGRAIAPEAQFQHALNAVVVELTSEEAARLHGRDDVLLVDKEHYEKLLTDRGPTFIGADQIWSGMATGGVGTMGEGLVIGEIDTGIAWDSPSFAATGPDDGYVHVNPLGAGTYLGTCVAGKPDAGHCNDKLIGMYGYVNTTSGSGGSAANYSAADDEGHGSHTASTVAGNKRPATYIGATFHISGVAPHASVIAYKVCAAGNGATCSSISSQAAANQAIADGVVDAINFSIGGGTTPWTDATSLAFLNAVNAGIFVATAGGNDGPAVSTISHIEPWTTTVAASTEDRVIGFPFNLTGATGLPANTQNIALRPAAAPLPTADMVNVPLVQSPTFSDGSNDGCVAYPTDAFKLGGVGAIAVLHLDQNASNCASGVRKTNATNAGAVGVIYVDPAYINLGASGNAWSMLMADWLNVNTQLQANPNLTASISATGSSFPSTGDVIADFSSRGPNTGISGQLIVKPEISAPGVDILAAYASKTSATASSPNLPQDSTRVLLENGTSMATPHIAGSSLLLRALHPTWSPVQIRSALMLTAKLTNLVKADGSPSDIFDRGAGRVDLVAAAKTGLVMDETYANFTAANPANGGKISTLNLPSMADGNCVLSCSFSRTVQSTRALGKPAVTWTLAVSGMPTGSTTVSPTSFKINSMPANSTFKVTVDATKLPDGISQGLLTLTPSDNSLSVAHMPIAVKKGPPSISVSSSSISATQPADQTSAKTITVTNVGNPTLNWQSVATPQAATLLNTGSTNNGELGGYYNKVPGSSYLAQNFDVPGTTLITRLTANGFTLPSATSLTTSNTPGVTFSIYPDANGVPAGSPGEPPSAAGPGVAPIYTYTNTIGAANGITTTSGVINLDLTATSVPKPTLQPGRYWLTVNPNINSNAGQTSSNPIWAWRASADPRVGNGPVIIGSIYSPPITSWEPVDDTTPSLSTIVTGNVDCTSPTWASYSGMSGSLAANGSATGTITFDSTGLSPGQYGGALCLTSNDPATPIKIISLTLNVTGPLGVTNAQATPDSVNSGATTLLTVNVVPAGSPASTGIQVRADLSSIGGSASQPMFDDGTNGDETPNDGVYSFAATIPSSVASGDKSLPVAVTDAQSRTASATISLTVGQQTSLSATASASPSSVLAGSTTHLTVEVTPGTNPNSTGITVVADLSSIGGSASQALTDNGDGTFSYDASIDASTSTGAKLIPVKVTDAQGRTTDSAIALSVGNDRIFADGFDSGSDDS